MTQNEKIAGTIMGQMGGAGRIAAMLGTKAFMVIDNGLQFDFKGSRTVNRCRVVLMPDDTYKMEFLQFRRSSLTCPSICEFSDVYCDQLVEIFESTTGLFLSL